MSVGVDITCPFLDNSYTFSIFLLPFDKSNL